MKASEIVTNAFGGNLVKDFADKVSNDLYHIARIVNNWEIDTTTEELTSLDTDLYNFMEQNEVPSCRVQIFKEDDWHFGIHINYEEVENFDWEVSEKVEKLHADDYEISKDSMHDYD